MPQPPVWKRRKEEAKAKEPCAVRCLRCLRRLARGETYELENDCKFATSALLIADYIHDGVQCNVCLGCLEKNNKDCYKPDPSTLEYVQAVDQAVKAFLAADDEDDKDALARDIQATAQTAVEWNATLGKKDSDFLFAHDGKGGTSQTKVKRAGRDRTKLGMARKRKAEEEMVEMDDDEYNSQRAGPIKKTKAARGGRKGSRRGA